METEHGGTEPEKTAEYLEPEYWNRRFRTEETYDWLKGYAEFRHLIRPHLSTGDKILVVGCGNSSLTQDLWRDGFQDVTSIDLSEVVVDKMRTKASSEGMHSLKWEVADMLALPYSDSSFDKILEKGTMDVLFVDNESPWEPRPEVCLRVHQMLAEIHRTLSPDGTFISITFAQPHFRRPFLTAPMFDWSTACTAFGETFHYFVYVMERGQKHSGVEIEEIAYKPGKYALQDGTIHEQMDSEDFLTHIDL